VQGHAVLDDEARCRDRGALTRAFRVGREGLEPPTPCASWTIGGVHSVLQRITQLHDSTPRSTAISLVGKDSIIQTVIHGPERSHRVRHASNVATLPRVATLLATSIGSLYQLPSRKRPSHNVSFGLMRCQMAPAAEQT
jgi:hypothetical protein